MEKKRYAVLFLTLALLLCACSPLQVDSTVPSPSPIPQPESTDSPKPIPPDNEEAEAEPPEDGKTDILPPNEAEPAPQLPDNTETEPEDSVPEEALTSPPHSELYLPNCSVEEIITYFEEVVLNVEYSDGTGADHLVQKWLTPLYYQIYGTPTDADLEVLNTLFAQLNAVPGFPGIYPAEDAFQENITISFLDLAAFDASFSDVIHGEYAFGAVQFWYYTDTNDLHTARIGYRTDIEQSVRNSVLVEEVINILGITDTVLRPDSITYQYANDITTLSDIDWVILKLLYSPSIQCGMDADQCAAIIRELYY